MIQTECIIYIFLTNSNGFCTFLRTKYFVMEYESKICYCRSTKQRKMNERSQ